MPFAAPNAHLSAPSDGPESADETRTRDRICFAERAHATEPCDTVSTDPAEHATEPLRSFHAAEHGVCVGERRQRREERA
jgi:hypothetical protein